MTKTPKPGWSAAELRELPVTLRIEIMNRSRPCSSCHRYIDNRNWHRHARSCAQRLRRFVEHRDPTS